MWSFYTQADFLIVGKMLGKELLGLYSVGMYLASIIMHKTGGVLYEVSLPSFSRVQQDPDRVAVYFLKAVRIMSFLVFPIFFGIASVAPEIVAVFLGDRWYHAGTLLAMLSFIMPLRMLANLFPPALQGVGRPDLSVKNLLLAMIVMPATFLVGVLQGILGVSIAWLTAFPVVFLFMTWWSGPALRVTVSEFVVAMLIPAIASILMYGAVMVIKVIIGVSVAVTWRLSLLITVGIFVYLILSLRLQRDRCEELLAVVKA